MIIQFTVQDLMIFLLLLLGIAAGILLLIVLWKIKKAASGLQSLVETNKESINKTIKTLPGIFDNVEQISSDIKETAGKLKVSVPVILQDVQSITDAAKGFIGNETALKKDAPGFMAYLNVIEDVLHIISGIFSSEKKK
jgi:predicted PurR-regulated permease PerM